MNSSFLKKIFWIALVIFGGSLILINLYSCRATVNWYNHDPHVLARFIPDAPDSASIDYYVGKMNDVLWGPLASLIGGGLFLLFCWVYLQEASLSVFALAVLAYFLLTRFSVLFNPPYGDVFTGPFADAIYLVRHSFDYLQYLQQPNHTVGGAKGYPTSIYPEFLAFLMKVCPTPKSFLVTVHFLGFVLSAWCVAFFRDILRRVFRCRKTALLGALLLLALPLYQSMTELLNMEMTYLFFAMAAIYCALRYQFIRAGIFAMLSVLVKAPGGIACAGVFFIALVVFLTEPQRPGRGRMLVWSVFVLLFAGSKAVVRRAILGDEQASHNMMGFMVGKHLILSKQAFWIYTALLAGFVIYLIVKFVADGRQGKDWRQVLNEHLAIMVMFFMAGMWFLLYMQFSVCLHRYALLLTPFYLGAILFMAGLVIKFPVVRHGVLSVAVLASLWGAYGFWYKHEPINGGSNTYERSLEYRNDLELYKRFANEIETNHADETIVAPVIFAELLDFREVGFVSKDLDVMTYGVKSRHESIRDFTGLAHLDIGRTVWVAYYLDQRDEPIPYPIDPQDRIIKKIEAGSKSITLFRGGIAVEKMRRLIEQVARQKRI